MGRPVATSVSGTFRERLPTLVLATAMFCTGACGLVSQYILSTVSTYILGNSIEQFSVVIALMLLAMGVAGMLQKGFGDDRLVERFVWLEASIGLLCGFAPIALYASFALLESSFVLVQWGLVALMGFLIGLEIPLAIRINERYAKNLKGNIASIWSLDYLGSFVGALIWAWWLIRVMPLTQISFVVGFLNLLVAFGVCLYFWRHGNVQKPIPALLICIVASVAMAYGMQMQTSWNSSLEQRLYDDPIVLSKTTPYQRIVVTQNRRVEDTRLYLNGNLQFSSRDEQIYHEMLVHPAMHLAASRSRVLVLGGGDGLAVREVLKYPDVREVTLVELDPAMVRLAREHPVFLRLNRGALADARVRSVVSRGVSDSGFVRDVHVDTGNVSQRGRIETTTVATVRVFTVDADKFLSDASGPFDVIIADLPDPNSIELAKLYSREFYAKAKRLLAPGGAMVTQATSPYHAKEAFLCIRRTLASTGMETVAMHDNVPSFGSWGWILASTTLNETAMQTRLGRASEFMVNTDYLTPGILRRSFEFGKGWLDSRHQDVSTLMNPVVLHRYLDESWQGE